MALAILGILVKDLVRNSFIGRVYFSSDDSETMGLDEDHRGGMPHYSNNAQYQYLMLLTGC